MAQMTALSFIARFDSSGAPRAADETCPATAGSGWDVAAPHGEPNDEEPG